ncbi:MAG TPA: glucose-6-phosphate dehydrogenase assembly protein OpcA [Micromonosporaceae bacterium]|nr:glucose-6-phosphate dehydrogenase assembly protein OpcA [Micromonosporaceae bacterium]
MLALWDTTGTEVVRKLAAERRTSGVASGLALTLVAATTEEHVRSTEEAATIAAEAHPCRLVVVVRESTVDANSPSRLDAEIIMGGRLGPCEAVVMRMSGRLALHAESVVVPLLAPDVPVVTWWHGPPPVRIANDPLGVFADRRITDVAQSPDPVEELHRRADDYAPGDTDLAWTRITLWRTLLASAFDMLSAVPVRMTVTAPATDPTAALLGGWLTARFGVPHSIETIDSGRLRSVAFEFDDGTELSLTRENGTAILRRTGQTDRVLPLIRRPLGDELAEELRRLDADQPYAAALAAATGVSGLDDRPPTRVHIWQDPALADRP